jgi:hypothetical protein
VTRVGESYIDHVAITKTAIKSVQSCDIYEDELENTSDHLPISVSLMVDNLPRQASIGTSSNRIAWKKLLPMDIDKFYTEPLGHLLEQEFPGLCIPDAYDIDKAIGVLVECIRKVSTNLKSSKYCKGLKPYWSEELESLHRQQKLVWHMWIAKGCPRGNDPSFIRYKTAKRIFRAALRNSERNYEKQQMADLARMQDLDYAGFWKLVNKSRKRPPRISPVESNGATVSDPGDICNIWGSYFKQLYTPKEGQGYDDNFKSYVEDQMEHMVTDSHLRDNHVLHDPFTEEEVHIVCTSLRNNKAPGWDTVTGEHLKYGGNKLCRLLAEIYNAVTQNESVPSHLKKGIINPIPKGNKDQSVLDNNRGITLLSSIAKVYEKLLYCRYSPWAKEQGIIDDLQGAAQDHCSSTHTTWLLRETIAHNRASGNTVYVALLDTSKAFDEVWIDGLLYQLYYTGIDGQLWRILRSFYQDFQCTVRIGSNLSEWFTALQGVHQGAFWSMHLYQCMNNVMIRALKDSGKGCQIDLINCTDPAYADDIAVATLHKPFLQRLMDIAFQQSLKWRFRFNAAKTEIIIFGKDNNPSRTLKLGAKEIAVKNKGTHMGVLLTSIDAEKSEWINGKVQVAKRDLNAILSLGSHRIPVSPKAASHLYWSVCMTKFCHGLEIAELPKRCIVTAEQLHGHAAKQIQGLPKQTINAACCAPLGWKTFSAHIELMQMTFLWRILLLPISCIYKQVAIVRLYHLLYTAGPHLGPLKDILIAFTKYNLLDVLKLAITHGTVLPINKAKILFKDKIMEEQNKRFRVTCMLYKRLEMFRACIKDISIWPWWIYVHYVEPHNLHSCHIMCRLVLGETRLNADTCRFNKSSPVCTLCDTGQGETAAHLLFMCPCFAAKRADLWIGVELSAPKAMVQDMKLMNPISKTEFIFSAFRCSYTPEWALLYSAALNFVARLYAERCKLDDQ